MQNTPNPSRHLALVAYPGAQMSALWGLSDLFALLPNMTDGPLQAVTLSVVAPGSLPEEPVDAFLFPPTIQSARPTGGDPLLRWARARHAEGALATSVCAGAFWLARAGLLDGRPATTHWALETEFRKTFPQVQLRPEQILVDDHDVVTAGGLMAWVDLGLHLTGLWFGPALATRLARHMLVDPAGREQRHYSSFRPGLRHGDAGIMRAQQLIERDYAGPLTIPALANAACLSPRTFQRHFERATGRTPSDYVQATRIEKARAALEQTGRSQADIGWSVGYKDTAAFARAFRSVIGLSPGAYRSRFRHALADGKPVPYLGSGHQARETTSC